MATYVYSCSEGHRSSSMTHGLEHSGSCPTCFSPLRRDYRAEGVGVAVEGLKRERENGGREGLKRLFLPHNDDFKGPGDPDGTKGMREWRDRNQPKAGNGKPDWPGFVDKKVM